MSLRPASYKHIRYSLLMAARDEDLELWILGPAGRRWRAERAARWQIR